MHHLSTYLKQGLGKIHCTMVSNSVLCEYTVRAYLLCCLSVAAATAVSHYRCCRISLEQRPIGRLFPDTRHYAEAAGRCWMRIGWEVVIGIESKLKFPAFSGVDWVCGYLRQTVPHSPRRSRPPPRHLRRRRPAARRLTLLPHFVCPRFRSRTMLDWIIPF